MVQYNKEASVLKNPKTVKKDLDNWILQHTHIVQSQIKNFLRVSIGVHAETHLFSTLLLHMYVQELHNSMVGTPYEGRINETRDADNNIIIIDSKLRIILPHQLNKMTD